jgi:NADPH2:quinone reductase
MVETMRLEGHQALIHTAAASNLGQMLLKITQQDGIPLINIVRRSEQAELLRSQGARFVLDSSAPEFRERLTDAIAETKATLAFDAIGGGKLASQILNAMEAAHSRGAAYSRYGSSVLKQVYIYGALDTSPTLLQRGFGFTWSVGGWLLPNFLQRAGRDTHQRLRARVASELTTTFASHYARRISLRDALDPAIAREYAKQGTGNKYLLTPHVS